MSKIREKIDERLKAMSVVDHATRSCKTSFPTVFPDHPHPLLTPPSPPPSMACHVSVFKSTSRRATTKSERWRPTGDPSTLIPRALTLHQRMRVRSGFRTPHHDGMLMEAEVLSDVLTEKTDKACHAESRTEIRTSRV